MSGGREPPVIPPSDPWPAPDLVATIRRKAGGRSAPVGLILGSGLAAIADSLAAPRLIAASGIHGYPESTVYGHRGRLLWGRLAGQEIWVVQGRTHIYEGYTAEETTRSLRLLHALGARILILTNAAGSVDREVGPGDLVLVTDTINLFFRPLAAAVSTLPVWRSRPATADRPLVRLAEEVAREERIPLRAGVLAGSLGPSYETAAEIRAWRRLGATVASMSTVPEGVQARELGMRCLLFSLVTNFGTGLSTRPLSHEDVVERAQAAAGKLTALLRALLPRLSGP